MPATSISQCVMRSSTLALIATCVAGCATLKQDSLDTASALPTPPLRPASFHAAAAGVSYPRRCAAHPRHRCVVCHGCYDAPCQLKLGSWEGIARGTSKAPVYDASRLREAAADAIVHRRAMPRSGASKGFDAVLNERTPSPENNLAGSVLYRALALKQAHPLPDVKVLPDDFDFSLDRSQSLPEAGAVRRP